MNSNKLNRDRRSPFSSIVELKSKVRNGYYFVLLRQIFISEVSIERRKFLYKTISITQKLFLRYRHGFHIAGHKSRWCEFYSWTLAYLFATGGSFNE